MDAERRNRSRTPEKGLSAREELRPREEAMRNSVISHENALPCGRLWERNAADFALLLSCGARPVKCR